MNHQPPSKDLPAAQNTPMRSFHFDHGYHLSSKARLVHCGSHWVLKEFYSFTANDPNRHLTSWATLG
jgi:hypothetical protein